MMRRCQGPALGRHDRTTHLHAEGHLDRVNAVTFSPDWQTLATCDHKGMIRLWRAPKPLRPSSLAER